MFFSGDQLSCIIELLGMPPQKLLDQSKRAKNFISSKGIYEIYNDHSCYFYHKEQMKLIKLDRRKGYLKNMRFKKNPFFAGYPRYCTATTLPDGSTVLNGGRYGNQNSANTAFASTTTNFYRLFE